MRHLLNIDLYATVILTIVAISSTFFAIKALKNKKYGFGGWLGKGKYIFFLVSLLSVGNLPQYFKNLETYREYTQKGIKTEGVVEHVYERKKRSLKSLQFEYQVTVFYRDQNLIPYRLIYKSNSKFDKGESVLLYYKTDNPRNAYVVTYHESYFHSMVCVIWGVCWGMIAFVTLIIIWLNRKSVLQTSSQ